MLLERLVRRAIERGKCRVDLLRGNEPYKYEWGAVDEPVQRILVRRTTADEPTTPDRCHRPAVPPAALADPCFEPVIRLPLPGDRQRIRVVELLATGSSGGAQEHVFNLVTRLDRARYDISVLALSGGPGVRRSSARA